MRFFPVQLVILIFVIPITLDLGVKITALLFVAFAIIPIIYSIKVERNIFEPISLVSIMYIFAIPGPFLFPKLYTAYIWYLLDPYWLNVALLWSSFGFASFLIGYYSVQYSVGTSRNKTVQYINHKFTLYITIAIGLLCLISMLLTFIMQGGVAFVFIESEIKGGHSTFDQVLHHLVNLRFPYILIYLVLRRRGIKKRILDGILCGILIFQLFEIVGAGSKASTLALLLSSILMFTFIRQRLMIKQFAIASVVLFLIYVVFSVVASYRDVIHYEFAGYVNEKVGVSSQIGSFKDAIKLSLSTDSKILEDTTRILNRLALVASFASTLQLSNGRSPYENAFNSLLIPIYAVLPRAIWPNKPVYFDSGRFAKEYFGWNYGGFSVSLLGSFYWAWGYLGIMLGMAGTGALFGYIVRKAKSEINNAVIYQVLLVIIFLLLLDAGRTFQVVVQEFIRIGILLFLVSKFYVLTRNGLGRSHTRQNI